jgi:RNA-directed DNA polymerase
VILVDAYAQHDWLLKAVEKRLREALAILQVTMNEAKSRIVDLSQGESCGFLGFAFRRVRSRTGKWRAYYPPLLEKRTALLRQLKAIFRGDQSQPIDRAIALITPILRGWVRYFAIGDASRCCGFMKDGVEKKVRRHLMRARNLRGVGWKRWSRPWLYQRLGLFNAYRVQRSRRKALPAQEVP